MQVNQRTKETVGYSTHKSVSVYPSGEDALSPYGQIDKATSTAMSAFLTWLAQEENHQKTRPVNTLFSN